MVAHRAHFQSIWKPSTSCQQLYNACKSMSEQPVIVVFVFQHLLERVQHIRKNMFIAAGVTNGCTQTRSTRTLHQVEWFILCPIDGESDSQARNPKTHGRRPGGQLTPNNILVRFGNICIGFVSTQTMDSVTPSGHANLKKCLDDCGQLKIKNDVRCQGSSMCV